MTTLTTTRVVTTTECPWLARDIPKGTVLIQFTKPTYGCITFEGVAVSVDGEYPFFEVPRDAVSGG